jgi:hypothetical protein
MRYGVGHTTIWNIAHGKRWVQVPQPEDYPLFVKDKGR